MPDRKNDPLKHLLEVLLPLGHAGNVCTISVDLIPVVLSAAYINIYILNLDPGLSLPGKSDDPEEDDNWQSKVGLEESLGSVEFAIVKWRGNSSVKLGNKSDDD